MAQQTINVGAAPNDGTGTPLRTAFQYTNSNFTELYTAVGPSGNNIVVPGNATITGDLTVDTSTLKVDSANNRVGVLTASPAYTLDVNGVANFKDATVHLVGGQPMFARVGSANSFLYAGTTALTVRNNADTSDLMTLNSSGNVGIGVAPSAWSLGKALNVNSLNGAVLWGYSGVAVFGNNFRFSGGYLYETTAAASRYSQSSGSHEWFNAPSGTAGNAITFTQAMTLDASGNLLVGTTSTHLSAHSAFQNNASGQVTFRNTSTTAGRYFNIGMESGSSMIVFNDAGVGVYLSYGTNTWGSTSDERLKDIIEPISNAVSKVGSLRSVIGKFKTDSEGTRRSFLIAQDVQAVLPEAVDTTNADAFGIRYTEVIPLLVAAIKELTARVQTLETR